MPVTRRFVYIAAIIDYLPIAFGCQTMRSETKAGNSRRKRKRSKIRCCQSPCGPGCSGIRKLDLSGVKVAYPTTGQSTASGVVSSLDARQQAIKLAWETRGVQSVVNSLEVQ